MKQVTVEIEDSGLWFIGWVALFGVLALHKIANAITSCA